MGGVLGGLIAGLGKGAPAAPTGVTATDVGTGRAYNDGAATVSFTAGAGPAATSYTATSSPGGFTATGASSPLTVTGLQSGIAYTFTVTATNAVGTSPASTASASMTATTVPQAPTIGTATDAGTGTSVTVTFTPGATGGKAISAYGAASTPSGGSGGGGSSPITVTGLTAGTAYTFRVLATNANGNSLLSAASNSVTPVVPNSFESIATITPSSGTSSITFSSIPSTYKSLQIRTFANNIGGTTSANITFNGVTTTTYDYHFINANGSSASANYFTNEPKIQLQNYFQLASTSTFAAGIIDIIDYASTSKNKTLRAFYGKDANGSEQHISLNSGLWRNTSAINSITITRATGSGFDTGTTFSLYGIKG